MTRVAIGRRTKSESNETGLRIRIFLVLLAFFLAVGLMYVIGTVSMLVATVNFGLLLIGYWCRSVLPKAHPIFMTAGVLGDLGLVLFLEIQREAIKTAMSFELSPFQQAHIYVSTLAVIIYVPVLVLGFWGALASRQSWGPITLMKWHPRLGRVALFFRTLGFFLMFSMTGR